jgi:glycosyltransferase involved in cell wall biosynthesis
MKISIIMVTLNAASVIEEALQSVQMQTYENLELIVVDGGSKDGTLDIVDSYTDLNPRILRGPDGGIYEAMNKGLAVATGQALHFLNADDRLAQASSLTALADSLHKQAADLVYGDVLLVQPDADRFRSHHRVRVQRLGYEPLSHQAVLARRSAFDRVGSFDTRYRICADLDWFVRCEQAGLAFSYAPRLVCRCIAGGLSHRHYDLQLREIQEILRHRRSPGRRAAQRARAGLLRRVDWLADRLLGRVQVNA